MHYSETWEGNQIVKKDPDLFTRVNLIFEDFSKISVNGFVMIGKLKETDTGIGVQNFSIT